MRFEDHETTKEAPLTFAPTTHSLMELGAMRVRGGSGGVARVMVKSGESPVTVGDAASYAENWKGAFRSPGKSDDSFAGKVKEKMPRIEPTSEEETTGIVVEAPPIVWTREMTRLGDTPVADQDKEHGEPRVQTVPARGEETDIDPGIDGGVVTVNAADVALTAVVVAITIRTQ